MLTAVYSRALQSEVNQSPAAALKGQIKSGVRRKKITGRKINKGKIYYFN